MNSGTSFSAKYSAVDQNTQSLQATELGDQRSGNSPPVKRNMPLEGLERFRRNGETRPMAHQGRPLLNQLTVELIPLYSECCQWSLDMECERGASAFDVSIAYPTHSHPTGCGETPFRAGLKKGGRRRIPTKESAV